MNQLRLCSLARVFATQPASLSRACTQSLVTGSGCRAMGDRALADQLCGAGSGCPNTTSNLPAIRSHLVMNV